MKKTILFVCFTFLIFRLLAQTEKPNLHATTFDSYENIIDSFFTLYESKNPTLALDFLFYTNPWLKNSPDKTSLINTNLNATIKILGDYSGKEFIVKKSIGPNFVLCSYMIKYTRQPIRFTFILYKPQNNWMIFNFNYDDKLKLELEESANIYRLPENLPSIK